MAEDEDGKRKHIDNAGKSNAVGYAETIGIVFVYRMSNPWTSRIFEYTHTTSICITVIPIRTIQPCVLTM